MTTTTTSTPSAKIVFDRSDDNAIQILPPPNTDLQEVAAAARMVDLTDIKQAVPIQTGALLPFANMNFLQYIEFAYTCAVMYYMDFLLNYMPWWQAIVATTATARLVFSPLVVRQNIIGIKSFSLLPETQKIKVKINDALATGDSYNQASASSHVAQCSCYSRFGMESSVDPKQGMAPIGRYLLRTMPFFMFLFIHNFPAATLLFWSTSNMFTFTYAMIMKNSWVKKKLNIPARLVHDPESLPLSNVSFTEQFKSAMEKGKVKRTSMDVRRLDDIAFRKAGVGPLRKTYKEPPKGA